MLPLLISALVGCVDSSDAPDEAATAATPLRARAHAVIPEPGRTRGTARIEPRAAGRDPVSREAIRRPPPGSAGTLTVSMQRGGPADLDEALLGMSPEQALQSLEEIQGPFEGAHYVLQRDSEVVFEDASAIGLDGELSVVDCRFTDPEDPGRGRSLWIGGLRTSEPDLFDGRIETRVGLVVFGREVTISGRWSDLHESHGRLGGLSRTLDAGIEDASQDVVLVWRSEVQLAGEPASTALFDDDAATCPAELTLHLWVEEHLDRWERVFREGEWHPARTDTEVVATPAQATLIARRVSNRAELFDPAQRTLRAAALPTRPAPALRVEGAPLPAR